MVDALQNTGARGVPRAQTPPARKPGEKDDKTPCSGKNGRTPTVPTGAITTLTVITATKTITGVAIVASTATRGGGT